MTATQRSPMLLFVLPGSLFKFKAMSPALVPLFQFPPNNKARAPMHFIQYDSPLSFLDNLERKIKISCTKYLKIGLYN